MRILVVEDEKDLRNIIKKRLVREHYSVDACGDGEEALDYMEMTSYDGVLLDIMLPGKDGFAVLKEVRQMGNDTPILLLPGWLSEEVQVPAAWTCNRRRRRHT